jgi:phosphatidylcholine synthase
MLPGVWAAALVHVFTALGVVCALLAMLAIRDGAWEAMFAWLAVALVIDGVDGTFARRLQVKTRLPRFSGERLDLIIDYLTYVVVPALALLQAGYLAGRGGVALAALVLLSSLFHFADTQSKADDHAFIGFPAIWNVIAFYVFAFHMPAWLVTLVVGVCIVLTFVPMKYPHPMRTPALRPATTLAVVLWAVAAALTLWRGFPAQPWVQAVLALTAAYGIVVVAWRGRTVLRR